MTTYKPLFPLTLFFVMTCHVAYPQTGNPQTPTDAQAAVAGKQRQQDEVRRKAEAVAAEEARLGGWRDPATDLVWTKTDNGVPVKAHEAEKYCKGLKAGGHSDWRLPTIKELGTIQDNAEDVDGFNVRGGIRLSFHCVMSSDHRMAPTSHITLAMEFAGTQEGDMLVASEQTWDAAWSSARCTVLCVRAPGSAETTK